MESNRIRVYRPSVELQGIPARDVGHHCLLVFVRLGIHRYLATSKDKGGARFCENHIAFNLAKEIDFYKPFVCFFTQRFRLQRRFSARQKSMTESFDRDKKKQQKQESTDIWGGGLVLPEKEHSREGRECLWPRKIENTTTHMSREMTNLCSESSEERKNFNVSILRRNEKINNNLYMTSKWKLLQ